ncbi:MAG: Nif3-like dinuclear metal center hexameric protein [Desulfonauticus sp.]|nr:Nif3-like dinuclear metal center hexameric protein [Desulfonauticus sp.]
MDVSKLIAEIEQVAPLLWAADWDKSGLLVTGLRQDIQKIAVALEPSVDVVNRAVTWGADFILTHHPLNLKPEFPSQKNNYFYVLKQLLTQDVYLYCAHTSLDSNISGPVSWLANVLKMHSLDVVDTHPKVKEQKVGFGIIGFLPEVRVGRDFVLELKSLLGVVGFRCIGKIPDRVERVAYCPGSGSFLAKKAFDLGADIFITGDVKYHDALELEKWGCVLDVGHFVLEEKMMEVFCLELSRRLDELQFYFFQGKDPFAYI